MKIPSKRTTETFTKTCVYIFKRSLLNRFRTQGKYILLQDLLDPEGQKIYDSLQTVWTGADDVLQPQTDVQDEVGGSGKSRM